MPSFTVIQSALRRTTEHLARELHAPGADAPNWNELEWSMARAVSTMQGITVLLANRLRWRGPASWREFLAVQSAFARQRDARIESLLTRIDAATRAAGVPCVGLKGSALRRLGLYRAGERPMGDVDLLIQPQSASRIGDVLRGLEYRPSFVTRRHAVYVPCAAQACSAFGEHPENPLKIEVHEAVTEALPVREVEITARLLTAVAHPGINAYPGNAELMRHLLLHAAGNMRAHALRQIQLHDIALLAARLDEADWRQLANAGESDGGAWWMLPPLALTERYYQGSVGKHLQAFAKLAPPLLRRAMATESLTEVSWSNLRIAAFPGILWSRSPFEALRFVHSRVFPSRTAIAELHLTEAAMPAMQGVPWYGVAHFRRITRWLTSRPPRVQTMISVRAAFADDSIAPSRAAQ